MNAIPRQPVRYDVALPVRIRSHCATSWHEGQLSNLSEGGLCVVSPDVDLLPGQSVEMVIETTDKFLRRSARRIFAKVIWSRGGRYGVQFKRRSQNPFKR